MLERKPHHQGIGCAKAREPSTPRYAYAGAVRHFVLDTRAVMTFTTWLSFKNDEMSGTMDKPDVSARISSYCYYYFSSVRPSARGG